jgi:hypothetical protein
VVIDIISKGELIGQVYDMNLVEGVTFPTDENQAFQFGFGVIDKDKYLVPHIHKRVERSIDTTSEFLYVVNGLMLIDIYDENEHYVKTIRLRDNQALLQHIGGHKITIKKGTKYFEIKQGPYYGRDFDKYSIEVD